VTLVARSSALSDIGLHRKTNEDAFVVAPPLFAVCDGMGGAQAGEVASGIAAAALKAGVGQGLPLLEAAEAANAAVYARAAENIAHTGMGTTLTAVVLEGDTGHFAHIGDSRAYLLRDRELQQVSEDHSLVGEMVRDGRLTGEEAAVHPHRSILSRALGTEPLAHIDEFEVDLRAGDVLLLCSDGLSGPVPPAVIQKTLTRADPADAAARLIAEARKAGGPDNITAVVLRLEDAPQADVDVTEEPTLIAVADEVAAAADEPGHDAAAAEPGADAAMPEPGADAAVPEPAADAAVADPEPDAAAAPDPRPSRRGLGCLTLLLALLVVVALAGALTLSTVFYVGVDDGRLAVYSGLPIEVGPLHLHAVYRRSPRSYETLQPSERRVVDARGLHGKAGVMNLSATLGMWP
jgi:serine/threonine protein phosphatase PrpC